MFLRLIIYIHVDGFKKLFLFNKIHLFVYNYIGLGISNDFQTELFDRMSFKP